MTVKTHLLLHELSSYTQAIFSGILYYYTIINITMFPQTCSVVSFKMSQWFVEPVFFQIQLLEQLDCVKVEWLSRFLYDTQHCLLLEQISHTALKYAWAHFLHNFTKSSLKTFISFITVVIIAKTVIKRTIKNDIQFKYRLLLWFLYWNEFILELNRLVGTSSPQA